MSHASPCGTLNTTVNSTWDKLKDLFGIIGLISIITTIIGLVDKAGKLKGWFETVIQFLGVEASVGFWLFAIVVYLVTVYLFFRLWYDECSADQEGEKRCASGVVEAVRGEDLGALLNASHPNIDVVIKLRYWFIVQSGADHIFCSDAGSPMLQVYYKSSRICAVKGGAAIGAAIAGAAGVVGAAAAAAAIGCATVILCALALLVAALIVIAAAIAGAFAGAGIAAAATDEDPASYDSGDAISVGDYVGVTGPTAKNMNFQGAIVQVFNEETALMGRATASPSFEHDDPDANIPDTMDVCIT